MLAHKVPDVRATRRKVLARFVFLFQRTTAAPLWESL